MNVMQLGFAASIAVLVIASIWAYIYGMARS